MFPIGSAEQSLVNALGTRGTATLDELVDALPQHTWNQIFLAVDRLSRNGTLTIRHVGRLRYLLTLASSPEPRKLQTDAALIQDRPR